MSDDWDYIDRVCRHPNLIPKVRGSRGFMQTPARKINREWFFPAVIPSYTSSLGLGQTRWLATFYRREDAEKLADCHRLPSASSASAGAPYGYKARVIKIPNLRSSSIDHKGVMQPAGAERWRVYVGPPRRRPYPIPASMRSPRRFVTGRNLSLAALSRRRRYNRMPERQLADWLKIMGFKTLQDALDAGYDDDGNYVGFSTTGPRDATTLFEQDVRTRTPMTQQQVDSMASARQLSELDRILAGLDEDEPTKGPAGLVWNDEMKEIEGTLVVDTDESGWIADRCQCGAGTGSQCVCVPPPFVGGISKSLEEIQSEDPGKRFMSGAGDLVRIDTTKTRASAWIAAIKATSMAQAQGTVPILDDMQINQLLSGLYFIEDKCSLEKGDTCKIAYQEWDPGEAVVALDWEQDRPTFIDPDGNPLVPIEQPWMIAFDEGSAGPQQVDDMVFELSKGYAFGSLEKLEARTARALGTKQPIGQWISPTEADVVGLVTNRWTSDEELDSLIQQGGRTADSISFSSDIAVLTRIEELEKQINEAKRTGGRTRRLVRELDELLSRYTGSVA